MSVKILAAALIADGYTAEQAVDLAKRVYQRDDHGRFSGIGRRGGRALQDFQRPRPKTMPVNPDWDRRSVRALQQMEDRMDHLARVMDTARDAHDRESASDAHEMYGYAIAALQDSRHRSSSARSKLRREAADAVRQARELWRYRFPKSSTSSW